MFWENQTFTGKTAEDQKNDFQTPPAVCKYMASLVPDEVKTVIEPTPGRGNLVKALQDCGYQVTAAGNFWDIRFTDRYDAVVCNLPFSGRTFLNMPVHVATEGMGVYYKALGMLLEMTNYMVALCPWFTVIDSDSRLKSLFDQGLSSVTHLPRKTFNYARIQTCVITLQKGYTGPVQFKRFDF